MTKRERAEVGRAIDLIHEESRYSDGMEILARLAGRDMGRSEAHGRARGISVVDLPRENGIYLGEQALKAHRRGYDEP